MLQQILSSRKSILLVLAGVILLALFALVWRAVALQRAASVVAPQPILKISYCGAGPQELCVLSFGRDAEENLAVNLFVPDRKFPDFYLKIKRITGESAYECEKNMEVPTSVFCYGDMVSLQEKMEIGLYSKVDDHLLAAGTLALNALLLSTQSLGGGGIPTAAPARAASATPETIVSTNETPVVTVTFTPDPSYPNPSYP